MLVQQNSPKSDTFFNTIIQILVQSDEVCKMNQSLTGRNGAILSLTEIFWACWNRSCDVVLQSGVDHSQMIFGRVPTSAAESRQTCQQTGFILLCHQDTLPIMAGYDWIYCSWYSVRCAQIYLSVSRDQNGNFLSILTPFYFFFWKNAGFILVEKLCCMVLLPHPCTEHRQCNVIIEACGGPVATACCVGRRLSEMKRTWEDTEARYMSGDPTSISGHIISLNLH